MAMLERQLAEVRASNAALPPPSSKPHDGLGGGGDSSGGGELMALELEMERKYAAELEAKLPPADAETGSA